MATKSSQFATLLLVLAAAAALTPTLVSGSGPGADSTAFIKSSCDSTLYPALCFSSLVRYADSVRDDPVRLAWLATNVTMRSVRAVSAHVSYLRRAAATAAAEGAALRDCAEALGDASELARNSAAEMGLLATEDPGPEMAWRVSNAQTWMSAVITNEETCADGFGPVAAGPLKADVCRRMRSAKEYASNALALVNRLVNSR